MAVFEFMATVTLMEGHPRYAEWRGGVVLLLVRSKERHEAELRALRLLVQEHLQVDEFADAIPENKGASPLEAGEYRQLREWAEADGQSFYVLPYLREGQ